MEQAILDKENNVVPLDWDDWKEQCGNSISTRVALYENDEFSVSTVFLGMAVGGWWFETMVFGKLDDDEIQLRAKTYEASLEQHHEVVGRMMETPNAPYDTRCSLAQLQFLGERETTFDELDKVDQFTFAMLG